MGRHKPNRPRKQSRLFGTYEMDVAVKEGMQMALRSNSLVAIVESESRLIRAARRFQSFEEFENALVLLDGMNVSMLVILPDVIEMECRLADLPNIDKGTGLFDKETCRTVRVYRYDRTTEA